MLAFRQEIEAFIQARWAPAGAAATAAEVDAWRRALVAAGWSVPHWPVAAGGTGWSPTQLFLWRQACAVAGAPLEDIGADIIGPLLLQSEVSAQPSQFLADIRNCVARWCIAFAEPEAGIDHTAMHTRAQPEDGAWRLDGAKTWVAQAHNADWICCYANLPDRHEAGLFAVPADAAGVTRSAMTTFDGGEDLADLTFDAVVLSSSALLAQSASGAEFAHLFATTELSTLSQSAVARAQLMALDAQLAALDPEDDLHAKRHAVAVQLEALEAMELRFLDSRERKLEAPFPLSILRLRSREILLQLGALQVESFGYYALPYPDEMLLHNEGHIGPPGAAAAVRQNLTRHVTSLYEGSSEQLRDSAWHELGNH